MLTVYSAHGSPGASTTALYLAAQWASTGTEVLLIEADPGGGSLSHHLGVQFTPGSASFVASGLTVSGGNLIDHSQDVLFSNLHVMPSTSSPTGAREIVRWWDERAAELRAISEAEMAVVIDGGRITPESVAADLAAHAAGVVVVARGDTSRTGLEHIGSLLSAETCAEGVERCVVTLGDSPLSAEEWREKCDITFAGSIMDFEEVTGDLTAFLNRNKRKSKKWRVSLEEVAEKVLPYAKPSASDSSRSRRPAAAEELLATEQPAPPPPAAAVEPAAAAAEPYEDYAAHEVHDEAPVAGTFAEAPPQPGPYHGAPAEVYGQAPQPAGDPYYQTAPASPYATAAPPPPGYQQYAPDRQPAYFEPPPAATEHVYDEAPLPVYQPPPAAHEPPQPQQPGYQMPPELLAVYQQQDVAPPWAPTPQEQSPYPQQAYQQNPDLSPPYHQQQPPPGPGPAQQPPHEAPPAYQQQPQQPPHEAPPAYQQQPHQAPPAYQQPAQQPPQAPPAYQQEAPRAAQPAYQSQPSYQVSEESAPAPQAAAYQPQSQPQQPVYQAPAPPQQAPPPSQPAPPAPTPHVETPPPRPDIAPSGSFRDWAMRLHAQAPHGTSTSGHGGVS